MGASKAIQLSQHMTIRFLLVLLLSLLCSASSQNKACNTSVLQTSYRIPDDLSAGGVRKLDLTVTVPQCPSDNSTASANGLQQELYPTIFLLNGFKMKASYYNKYVQGLTAHGYAVVQYDFIWIKTPNDKQEVDWLPGLLTWLQDPSKQDPRKQPGAQLLQQLDFSRMGISGHSHGGKLAALHFAGSNNFTAAVLMDPVDHSRFAPERPPEYPSGCKALHASGKPVAIIGAGVSTKRCNPRHASSAAFFNASALGSWYMKVAGAGHASFMEVPKAWKRPAEWICKSGKETPEDTIDLTIQPMVAWFDRHLLQKEHEIYDWVQEQEKAGRVMFRTKGQPSAETSDDYVDYGQSSTVDDYVDYGQSSTVDDYTDYGRSSTADHHDYADYHQASTADDLADYGQASTVDDLADYGQVSSQ